MTTDRITVLLKEAEQGNAEARNRLFDEVYNDLKAIAAEWLQDQGAGDTFQPSALVHEVYLRLFPTVKLDGQDTQPRQWTGREQFFGVAASTMHQVLANSDRRKSRAKRGPDLQRILVDPNQISAPKTKGQLLALEEAMAVLQTTEPLVAEVVRLRFFAGLTLREVADELGIGRRTADGYWAYAKAWLIAEIDDANGLDKRAS